MKWNQTTLSVEQLEARDVPSTNPVTLVSHSPGYLPVLSRVRADGGNLFLGASPYGDRVEVQETQDKGAALTVTINRVLPLLGQNTEVYRIDLSNWSLLQERITFQGGAGNDIFRYLQARGDQFRFAVLAIGGEGNNTLYGGTENDLLIGGQKNDSLYGDGGDDLLIGGAGEDQLSGSAWASGDGAWRNGASDHNVLIGGADKDTLIGGPQSDVLDGGQDRVQDLLHPNGHQKGGMDFCVLDDSQKYNEMIYGKIYADYLPVTPANYAMFSAMGTFESAVRHALTTPGSHAGRADWVNTYFDHKKEPSVGEMVARMYDRFHSNELDGAFASWK
ncbi:MAG: hypothetical protein K2R98_15790 [Gemmataceae bacterium]|nr:hypothetical protein [Gemmataceae bacterium]